MKECGLIKGGHTFRLLVVMVNKSYLYDTEESVQSNQEGNNPTCLYRDLSLKKVQGLPACRRLMFPLLNRRRLHAGNYKEAFHVTTTVSIVNDLMPCLMFFLQGEMCKTC